MPQPGACLLLGQNHSLGTRHHAKSMANDLLLLSGSRFPCLALVSSSLKWDKEYLCG